MVGSQVWGEGVTTRRNAIHTQAAKVAAVREEHNAESCPCLPDDGDDPKSMGETACLPPQTCLLSPKEMPHREQRMLSQPVHIAEW